MGCWIKQSVIVSGHVVYRLKFATVFHRDLCWTQRSPPTPSPAPAEKRTKGQVQLPSLIHCCLKLTLCVPATNAQAPIAGKPSACFCFHHFVQSDCELVFIFCFLFFLFCQISRGMHAVDNFSELFWWCHHPQVISVNQPSQPSEDLL